MAEFGGTIKLTGADEYKKALNDINRNLKEVGAEMKLVSSSFDKNDKSVDAVSKRTEVLNQKMTEQQKKADLLKQKYEQMVQQYGKNSQAQAKLTSDLEKEKAKLQEIATTLGTSSNEYKEQEKVVQKLENKQKTYNDTISQAKIQMQNAQAEVNKTAREIDNLGKETEETSQEVKKAGDGFTVFKGILANLGTQAINGAINGLKSIGSALISVGKQAIENYADFEQLVGGVETLFGAGGQSVEEYAKSVGKSVSEVQDEYNNLQKAQSEVLTNANNAYKTAGMSANEYMETVTSFSASLISSLDGDTVKAAKAADQAITDMSDNANKMGTDITSIQNAYQGFAKQNYTMLDNLKLGYGGTKTEMERLLADAEKFSGVKYDISNLNDVYEAIHVVQTEMGITGTTAKEASQTISGSVAAMGSAWQNLLTGMADDNANFEQLIDNFVNSVITVGDNIIPRIKTVISGIGQMVSGLLKELVPKLVKEIPPLLQETLPILIDSVTTAIQAILDVLPMVIDAISQMIPQIIQTLLTMLPQLIDVGIKGILSLIQGLGDALPQLIAMLPSIIMQIVDTLLSNLPLIIDTGIQVIFALVDGLIEALPQLIDYMPEIIDKMIIAITDNLPKIVEAGITLIIKLAEGLIKALPQLISKIPQIMGSLINGIINYYGKLGEIGKNLLSKMISGIGSMLGSLGAKAGEIGTTIINKIRNLPNEMLNWGKDMIQGLINGIKNMIGNVGDAVSGVAEKIKSFLHFSRPDIGPLREYEEWMPDFINGLTNSLKKASPELINQTKSLANQMANAIPSTLETNIQANQDTLNGNGYNNTNLNYNSIVEAFKEALGQMKVELDDEEAGRFVRKTVENAIYT